MIAATWHRRWRRPDKNGLRIAIWHCWELGQQRSACGGHIDREDGPGVDGEAFDTRVYRTGTKRTHYYPGEKPRCANVCGSCSARLDRHRRQEELRQSTEWSKGFQGTGEMGFAVKLYAKRPRDRQPHGEPLYEGVIHRTHAADAARGAVVLHCSQTGVAGSDYIAEVHPVELSQLARELGATPEHLRKLPVELFVVKAAFTAEILERVR